MKQSDDPESTRAWYCSLGVFLLMGGTEVSDKRERGREDRGIGATDDEGGRPFGENSFPESTTEGREGGGENRPFSDKGEEEEKGTKETGIMREDVSDIEVALKQTSLIACEGVTQPQVRAESTESQTNFLAL